MRSRSTWLLLLTTWGCADREALREEPDRVALCSQHCAQLFGPCNPGDPTIAPGSPQTEDECNSNCVVDVAWEDDCRFAYEDKMTCSTELSCEEFQIHETNVLEDPCLETENAWSSCAVDGK